MELDTLLGKKLYQRLDLFENACISGDAALVSL